MSTPKGSIPWELFEALQSVIQWADNFQAPLGTVTGDAQCFVQARAALAKAAGQMTLQSGEKEGQHIVTPVRKRA